MNRFTDRDSLRSDAYADTAKLRARMSIYEFQHPRNDLRVPVSAFLREVSAPILDVGCGAGGYTRALRADGHTVIAVDLSEGMAAAAGAPAAVADATSLPFRDRAVGAATALHMLYHVPDPPAALAEIRRVLRPGGIVVISTNASDDKVELRRLHIDAAAEVGFALPSIGPAERFHLDRAESIARQYFEEVERHDLESVVSVPIPEPVVAFIDSTRSWYGDGEDVLEPVRRLVQAEIAATGAFTFRTHSGFLVCRD
jgi:ubiquinone/menaquinone biosynthesis C-methylase UbiE